MENYSKRLLSLILCVMTTSLYAQWAGPDKTYLVNQSVGINIGKASQNDGEFCYTWSAGPNGHIDPDQDIHSPVIRVYPTAEEEVYYVQRVGIYGVEEDEVIIRRVNSITISATPKKSCFNAGETISVSDFEITTSPEGFEQMVSIVSPRGKKFNDNQSNTLVTTEFVTLGIRGVVGPETHDIQVPVDVVHPEHQDDLTSSTSYNVGDLLALLLDTKTLENKLINIKKKIDKVKGARKKVDPCDVTPRFNLELDNYSYYTKRCQNGQLEEGLIIDYNPLGDNQPGIGIDFDCIFPFAGCRYLASANLEFGGSVLFEPKPTYGFISEKTDLNFDFSIYFSFYGGIGASVLAELVAHAQLRIEAGIIIDGLWKPVARDFSFKPVSIPVNLVGSVEFFSGIFEAEVSYELCRFYFVSEE